MDVLLKTGKKRPWFEMHADRGHVMLLGKFDNSASKIMSYA